MEEVIFSSNDSEGDTDSDGFSKEREEELYSVLHHNDFSQGVPAELLEKYRITTGKGSEYVISFRNPSDPSKPSSGRDGSKPKVGQREAMPLEGLGTIESSSCSSSDETEPLVVELEPTQSNNKSPACVESTLNQNSKDSVNFKPGSSKKDSDIHQKSAERVSTPKNVSLLPELAANPKGRCGEDGLGGNSTSNIGKTDSGHTVTRSTKVVNPKRRKLHDVESTLAPISKDTDDVELEMSKVRRKEVNTGVESKITPNPKKRKSTGGTTSNPSSKGINHEDAVASKMAGPSVKGRVPNEIRATSPIKMTNEEVVEEHSDSDDSSCVIVEDPEMDRKISLSSTDSVIAMDADLDVVALLSSEDEVSSFSLNTTGDIPYDDSDGNVSDVIETSHFGWEEVASPSTWTKEMKKYYNSSCERLRYFDHKKIRHQLKTGSHRDWLISPKDLFPKNKPRQRCLICRQSDHLARNCPKKDPPCHMCGTKGHSNMDCPNSICLQCGKKNRQFTSVCRSCTHLLSRECFTCKQTGHESKACPEKWREFHSTTEGSLKRSSKRHDGNRTPQCCNCGKANHTFEECNQQYMSTFAKSLPAYNWLYGRGSGCEDWRNGFSGGFPRNSFEPPFKRRKYRGDQDSFSDGIPRWAPVSSKPRHRKKKKKPKNGRMFLP